MRFTNTVLSVAALLSLAHGSPVSTTSVQSVASTTTSSNAPCPTTPEDGTYCGFINPEDPCAPQPGGQGPKMEVDTVEAFQNYKPFQSMSLNATTPQGYTNVYKNLTTASMTSNYIGLYLLDSYDTMACAAKCNEVEGCVAFDVYAERDPTLNPCKNDSTAPTVWGYWCPVPASMTNYKCALWGSGIDTTTSTNHGQNRGDFVVVISGSNGYTKFGHTVAPTAHKNSTGPYKPLAYTGAASAGAAASWSLFGLCSLAFVMVLGL